ncbi:MAG TPA: hypothetical protein VHT96_06550 [Clostridia bacterium]|nr:hypothetical protein [Clostridia bacterium]
MGKNRICSSYDDVAVAMELVKESRMNLTNIKAFELQNIITVANFGCISNTDKVLVVASEVKEITLAVSYIYTPKILKSFRISINTDVCNNQISDVQNWEMLNQILSGHSHTKPTFHISDIDNLENENEKFDIAIAGYINSSEMLADEPFNRFKLEAGIEFDIFNKLLIKTCKLLKTEGKLLILVKAGWVLMAWTTILELGLQLEYDSYRLYISEHHHPNAILWLRLVKRENKINHEEHKRNIRALMEENNIDRLYAHRNDLIFPYVELSNGNNEAYVTLRENKEYLQYFFSRETTENLASLCEEYTACLVTPSVAQYAHSINKNVVLFERDNRFREKGGLKFVKYDLEKGLTKFQLNKYARKFNTVLCDPPFDINLDVLARDIVELIGMKEAGIAYIVFPESRKNSLIRAMKAKGFLYSEGSANICIEYVKPPKIVRIHGKQAIQLYAFACR